MTQSKRQKIRAEKGWRPHFIERFNREPTKLEIELFKNGFSAGWNAHMKRASKYLYEELCNLHHNLEDDLELDLKDGEHGYKTHKKSYEAIKKYTLKILNKKIKNAEHNAKLSKNTNKIPISSIDGKPMPEEVVKGLSKALDDFKKGRYTVTTKLTKRKDK